MFGEAQIDVQEGLFYFRFDKNGFLDESQGSFKNYISEHSSLVYSLQSSGTRILDDVLTKSTLNEIYKTASIRYDVAWDGIACADSSAQRLYLEKDDAHVLSRFKFFRERSDGAGYEVSVGEEHRSITAEFWFRFGGYSSENENGGERVILSIKKENQVLFTVMMVEGQLYCFPFFGRYGLDERYSLHYLDYKFDDIN